MDIIETTGMIMTARNRAQHAGAKFKPKQLHRVLT
jgi:hypothetical protein